MAATGGQSWRFGPSLGASCTVAIDNMIVEPVWGNRRYGQVSFVFHSFFCIWPPCSVTRDTDNWNFTNFGPIWQRWICNTRIENARIWKPLPRRTCTPNFISSIAYPTLPDEVKVAFWSIFDVPLLPGIWTNMNEIWHAHRCALGEPDPLSIHSSICVIQPPVLPGNFDTFSPVPSTIMVVECWNLVWSYVVGFQRSRFITTKLGICVLLVPQLFQCCQVEVLVFSL